MYKELSEFIKSNDNKNATRVVMYELGKSLANDKDNFLEVLENAGIKVNIDTDRKELVEIFVENAPRNKKLLLGASYLINHQYRTVGIDGSEEVNEQGIKDSYKVMDEYFNYEGEGNSNFVGAIAGAVGEGAKLGTTIAGNVGAKKQRKHEISQTAQLALNKGQEANQAMLKGVVESRQKAKDNKLAQRQSEEKTLRVALIAGSVLVAIVLGVVIYKKIEK